MSEQREPILDRFKEPNWEDEYSNCERCGKRTWYSRLSEEGLCGCCQNELCDGADEDFVK